MMRARQWRRSSLVLELDPPEIREGRSGRWGNRKHGASIPLTSATAGDEVMKLKAIGREGN